MVEVFIGQHQFQITAKTWTKMQTKLNRINKDGHTEFGFTDAHGTYWDIRINTSAIIVANYGKAPEHMREE